MVEEGQAAAGDVELAVWAVLAPEGIEGRDAGA